MVIDNKNRVILVISMLLLLCLMAITSYAEETTIETTAVTGGGGQTNGGGAGRDDVLADKYTMRGIQTIISKSWELMQTKFPGTSLTFGSIGIGFIITSLAIKLLKIVTGGSNDNSCAYATKESRKKYIAKGRENDEI